MRLVIFDLIPTVLTDSLEAIEAADEALRTVASRFHIVGIADSDRVGASLRRALEDGGLSGYFETVNTAASLGPSVSPRVIRRMSAVSGFGTEQVVVVTARPELAEALRRSRITTVLVAEPGGISAVPETLERIVSGRLSP
jgi:hypothetical protein